jgi:hypothetical protein
MPICTWYASCRYNTTKPFLTKPVPLQLLHTLSSSLLSAPPKNGKELPSFRFKGTGFQDILEMNAIGNWLTKNAVYTIYRCDMRKSPERSDFPGWNHGGNHLQLGRLYWNMFHASFKGTLEFSDMPDFSGTIQFDDLDKPVSLFGDIGRVSASTDRE